jgi:anti-sigma factor ChrR (cupin superfamily)
MQINADLSQRAQVDTAEQQWVPSPEAGVERKMLDRDGGEVARATSLVRFAPDSTFAPHEHGGGEEFLVLEGVFSDENGDYPAGTYVRHPPSTSHTPFSRDGCVIFVKLRQMEDGEPMVSIDTNSAEWQARGEGLSIMPLYENANNGERVFLFRFAPGASVAHDDHPAGEEVLVLEGVLEDEHGRYPKGTWLRCPSGSSHAPFSAEGCTLWVKKGHLSG